MDLENIVAAAPTECFKKAMLLILVMKVLQYPLMHYSPG